MSAIEKLAENIRRTAGRSVQTQIRLVECVSVDWDAKTMTAKGMADETDYLDVSLGLGAIYTRPASGSACLIGIIDGLEVASFLVHADKAELVEIRADSIVCNDGGNAGLVNVIGTTAALNAIQNDLNTLKKILAAWTPVPEDGGASLKGAAASWSGQALTVTRQSDIEDIKIKH